MIRETGIIFSVKSPTFPNDAFLNTQFTDTDGGMLMFAMAIPRDEGWRIYLGTLLENIWSYTMFVYNI